MLNEDNRVQIRDFVKRRTAVQAGAEPGEVYFKGKGGRSLGKAQGVTSGVYVSRYDQFDELVRAVEDHVVKTWSGTEEPPKVWLLVYEKGQTTPDDYIEITFPEGRKSALDEFKTSDNRPNLETAAATALLDVVHMLKDQVVATSSQNRELIDIAVDAKVQAQIANATLQVIEQRQSEIRFERMFDRLDPHLEKWFPALILSLGGLAAAYASKDIGPPPADDEQRMADWHIERVIQSVAAMGLFFETKPELLTEKREKKLGDLLMKMMAAFQEMKG